MVVEACDVEADLRGLDVLPLVSPQVHKQLVCVAQDPGLRPSVLPPQCLSERQQKGAASRCNFKCVACKVTIRKVRSRCHVGWAQGVHFHRTRCASDGEDLAR